MYQVNFTRATCDEPPIAFFQKQLMNCNEPQRKEPQHDGAFDDDDDDVDDNDNDYDDEDDVSGKRAGTDQSRATFKAKRGSSTSPVDTMI